jgi:hypothetical protein
MAIKSLYALLQLLLLIASTINGKAPANDAEARANAAFGRVKGLAGEWQSVGPNGQHSRLTYQLISGSSTVMERFSSDALPPKSGEMVTMYYIERGELVLTHYCIANNQPHLRATLYDPRSGELNFDFVNGANIASGNEGHMHSLKIHFIDNDHFSSEWQFMQGGLPKSRAIAQFTRVK